MPYSPDHRVVYERQEVMPGGMAARVTASPCEALTNKKAPDISLFSAVAGKTLFLNWDDIRVPDRPVRANEIQGCICRGDH
jgi:hypothetical protein